jgi:hypothetical protein
MRLLRLFVIAGMAGLLLGAAANAANVTLATNAENTAVAALPPALPDDLIVRILSTDHYQIEVQNNNEASFIKSFVYTPPNGLTISAVTGVLGGTCSLSSGAINCTGKIVPPTCDGCVGASLIVNFTARGLEPTFGNGYWTYYGVVGGVQVTGTTPVEKSTFGDLPLCKKGQKSTKAHACVKA